MLFLTRVPCSGPTSSEWNGHCPGELTRAWSQRLPANDERGRPSTGPRHGSGGSAQRAMTTYIVFSLIALAAAVINSIAGGGGLLTFPVLALLLPPVIADATSGFAMLPAYFTATWGSRKELTQVDPPHLKWSALKYG